MSVSVEATYQAWLTTPVAFAPDLEQGIDPIGCSIDGLNIQITLGEFDAHKPYADGCEPGDLRQLVVCIDGDGDVIEQDCRLRVSPMTFIKYERTMIEAVGRFLTWIRIKKQQFDLNDRRPVVSYEVEFVHGEHRMPYDPRYPSRFGRIDVDTAYGALQLSDIDALAVYMRHDNEPLGPEHLLSEARALLFTRHFNAALVMAVSALEFACRDFLPDPETKNSDGEDKGVMSLFKIVARKLDMKPIDKQEIFRIIVKRNEIYHTNNIEADPTDTKTLARFIDRLRQAR